MAVPVIAVHGGAGSRAVEGDAAREDEARAALAAAVECARAWITEGALAAAVAAVTLLEDCPIFNAGMGSVLASDGGVWCDASVMTGDGRAGAVSAVQGIRNPVRAAEALLLQGELVLWTGSSDQLAADHSLERVDPEAMITERQRERLRDQRTEPVVLGTVGAVCRDASGRIAAATSTGGRSGKPPARVGDSPVIGAGTWADDGTCAVSATGHGEAFLRVVFAHQVHARMRFAGEPIDVAARNALEAVSARGGRGGAICVAADDGRLAMPVSSEVMYRAWSDGRGPPLTAIGALEAGVTTT
jgi:L-asparaginase / beta-aspartyl-peptidase